MKIAIVLNRTIGQLTIVWPNDEQHTYFVASAVQPGDCVEMVEHEIRDAVADTMQDLIKRGLVRIAGYAVPDGRPAEFAMKVQNYDPWEPSEQIWLPGGINYTTERPPQSRRRLFNEGAGELQLGEGPVISQLGAGELQLRSIGDRIPTEIRHMPATQDGEAWEVTYSDGTSEIVRDACNARSLAEYIYQPR